MRPLLDLNHNVHTLDLGFLDLPGTIAAYLIPHAKGAVLVECGPGSTIANLIDAINAHGFKSGDITDVLITHIHLDHAGSAGWWARQGARIHLHPVGAPHMEDPEKLLMSASRIYGEKMESLWGEFLPVPAEKLIVHSDDEVIEIEDLQFTAIDTPGHAFHHLVYLFEDHCFSGDIGGVRVGRVPHLSLPMVPPEFHLELWRESLNKLVKLYHTGRFSAIVPTHFGIFSDSGWQLSKMEQLLTETETWIVQEMAQSPSVERLNEKYLDWVEVRAQKDGLSESDIQAFEAANPSWMSASGIFRYWHKVRNLA